MLHSYISDIYIYNITITFYKWDNPQRDPVTKLIRILGIPPNSRSLVASPIITAACPVVGETSLVACEPTVG